MSPKSTLGHGTNNLSVMQYVAREEGFRILRHFAHGSKAGTLLPVLKAIEIP